MLCRPLNRKLITQATVAYGATSAPNNSMAIILAASGVLAVPASTATKPKAAIVALSVSNTADTNAPACAPIKNSGVIIPPTPPAAKVTVVVKALIKNPNGCNSA